MIELTGITWRHTRGYLPMVATAQRFAELNPYVSIRWEVRSLQQFADFPIQELAKRFDLLVIDHPSSGCAAAHDALVPLDEWLPGSFLEDQASNSVGRSHESYFYREHQWALATDAATPISGWRPDVLEAAKATVPQTWPELLDLAARGLVVVPAIPIDSLMHFYMLCGALGEEPFQNESVVVSEEIGAKALVMLKELLSLCDPACFERNPIATWELLSSGNTVAYCPFAYGYSNYSRLGYSRHAIETGGLISLDGHRTCRSTLGGAGIAISSQCRDKEAAAQYAQFVAGEECQITLYFDSGGQPGYRRAWLDPEVNRRSNNFFRNTLPTLDAAYLRPRFDGYLEFQDRAGVVVHNYLTSRVAAHSAVAELNVLLQGTRTGA